MKKERLQKLAGVQLDENMNLHKQKSTNQKTLEIVFDQIRRAKQSINNNNIDAALEDINKALKMMLPRITK